MSFGQSKTECMKCSLKNICENFQNLRYFMDEILFATLSNWNFVTEICIDYIWQMKGWVCVMSFSLGVIMGITNIIWMGDLIIKNRSFYWITRLQSHCRWPIKECFFKCGKLRLKFIIENRNVTVQIVDENSWHNFRIESWINLR